MNNFFFLLNFIFILKSIKPEKLVEINFYRNLTFKNASDYLELITNKLYVTISFGSNQNKIDLPLVFYTPYTSISSEFAEKSPTYQALEPNYTFYSRTEFNYAQKAKDRIKLNEKTIIDDYKFISDGLGEGKLGINLNFQNNELLDFNFFKNLIRNDFIETYDMKILYNENDLTSGKIIFGSSPQFTIPMHIEDNTIFYFRVDQITYQDEDYTTEIGLDFSSGGIVVPGNCFKKIEKFFEPFVKNNTCKYILLPNNYDTTFFCYENFHLFENFEKIYININDFEFKYSFILEGKDLFMKVNNGYLFLIRTFIYYASDRWVLGLPFFSKYPVSLNLEKKLVGFDINKEVEEKPEDNNNFLPWILFCSIAFFFLILVGINVYIFIFKKKRKTRANELDEDIIYDKKTDEENKLGI
jgi:hypothetical protein